MNEMMMAALFDDYKQVKRRAAKERDQGEGCDIVMLMYVGDEPDDEGIVAVAPISDTSMESVAALIAATMARAFIPYWVAILSDGYVAKHSDVTYPAAGGLEALFRAGDSNVQECLTITVANHAGEVYADSATYWFDDDGDVWFDESEGPANALEGPMIDVLKDVTSLWGKTQAEIITEIMKRSPTIN